FVLPTSVGFSEEASDTPRPAQGPELKISKNAVASLENQLPEEKFHFIEQQLIDKEMGEVNFSLLLEQKDLSFNMEELTNIQQALELYFEMLDKIKTAAPAIFSLHELLLEKKKLKESLDSLMTDEKEAALAKIDQLQEQQDKQRKDFKRVAEKLNLSNITLEKLPGMLRDLEYKDNTYDVMYTQLAKYLGQVKKIASAESIITSLDEVSKAIKQTELELQGTQNEGDKKTLTSQIEKLAERKKALETDFTINVTGMNPAELDSAETKEVKMEDELRKIFSPLVVSLKAITETSRKIEDLRSVIAYCEQHLPKMRYGLEEINSLLSEVKNRKVKKNLLQEKAFWEQREKELATKLEIANQQVVELQNKKYTPVDMLSNFFQAVFSKRGINILFAFVVFFTMYFVRRFFIFINPFERIPTLNFLSGTINVTLYLLTFIIAFLSTIIYLYMVGEIISLLLVLMLLFVIGLAMKETLPRFIGEIRLLLGYGPVRRGEKVIYNSIPWQITSIGLYSELKNPLLAGANLRLPIHDLSNMRSRPYDKDEPWFPTRKGDWVILADGTYGQVEVQSPDLVQIKEGGAYKNYTPSDFLRQHPSNLSMNLFTVDKMLHLDIRHSEVAITKASNIIKSLLKKAVEQQTFGKHLKNLVIELHDIESASLKIGTRISFSGKAASKYREIGWLVQQVALNACNKNGWQIASQQITMHQAEPYEVMQVNQQTVENPA
ncbi:MAG: hypothetical protein D3910_10840, partial [Candidatus Electrothrix sp. ATG2]|nr:hypothetical protein [Candidatus Electrothrix sp. ATG2]